MEGTQKMRSFTILYNSSNVTDVIAASEQTYHPVKIANCFLNFVTRICHIHMTAAMHK